MIEYIIKGCQIGLAAFAGIAVFIGAWVIFAVLIALIGMAVDKLKGDEK